VVLHVGAALGGGTRHRGHLLHACRVQLRDHVSAVQVEGHFVPQGLTTQHIKSAMVRTTWQISPKTKAGGLLRQGREGSRTRHERRRRSGDGVPDLDLAQLHHGTRPS